MIVAGEPSGDAHAARLVRELRHELPGNVRFFGAVSHGLREQGVEEIVNADDLAVVGVLEIAMVLPVFWRAYRRLRAAALKRRPDAVVLVDFPDFNLKLARALGRRGIRIIYYISPQIWAWRKYRISTIRKYVDLLLTILPFEKEWYSRHGFESVEYVGNPTVNEVHAGSGRGDFFERHALDPERPLVALLPGSRHKEIFRILPEMLRSAALMRECRPELQFVIALAPTRRDDEIDAAFRTAGINRDELPVTIVRGETYDAIGASDAAAVTSGTATLETGILGTPMAIVYKGSALNYVLLRPLIDVPHFGLINLIAGERLAAELIQYDFTPKTLRDEILRLLEPGTNAGVRARLAEAKATLGHGGASKRAAEAIVKLLAKEPT